MGPKIEKFQDLEIFKRDWKLQSRLIFSIFVSVAMPADSRREKIFDFVREFAVNYFRIVPVRDSTQQSKA